MVLLWTNPDPSAEFAAQTISLNLTGYYGALVVSRPQAVSNINVSAICLKGDRAELVAVRTGKLVVRNLGSGTVDGVSDSGVNFSGGLSIATYGQETSSNTVCVPVYIFGLR